MATRNPHYGWLRRLSVLFACLLCVHLAQAQTYSVTTLGSPGSWIYHKGINASGQVAFSDYIGGVTRTYFFDGTAAQDIGSLGGDFTTPSFITDAGQVVGDSYIAGNLEQHAFSWTQAGGMVDLTLGGTYSYLAGVNAAGQVVGSSYIDGDAAQHAFSWTAAGGTVDLGTLGGAYSAATGINAAGQVVGYAQTAGGNQHAFSWTPAGGMVDLGTLGGIQSAAIAVDAAGQVIGYAEITGGAQRAFSWIQGGGMVDLGDLGTPGSTQILGMTAGGQVIGYSKTGAGARHAFSWTRTGGMVDLGTLGGAESEPLGFNASGQVVGYSYLAGNAAIHAFSWTPAGGMVDLNAHIPGAPSGTELQYGLAISDNGAIAAYANTGTVLLKGATSALAVGPIMASDPVAAGIPVAFSAQFTDGAGAGAHTAHWSWGDATEEGGIVTEADGSGTASGTHAFAAAGIYTVELSIADSANATAQASREIVVYDPAAGFVTGDGWIGSPPGAYKANETLAGIANFSLVSRYKKGAARPNGTTAFQLSAANLNFVSDDYDWLVIAGARAQARGTGTVNGAGTYRFELTAIDGKIDGGAGVDRFRIRIWHYDPGLGADVVDYDNQIDPGAEGTPTEGTAIGGGNIVIHK